VAVRLEVLVARELVDGAVDLTLEALARRDVGDLAAADAEQMVMVLVLGEVLRQLDAGELVVGRDATASATAGTGRRRADS
jgi:hypothetical protein